MICPMMQNNGIAAPCKMDGGTKGTGCEWWDADRKQCAVKSIVNALEGIERVLPDIFTLIHDAAVEFKQFIKAEKEESRTDGKV